MSGVTFSLELDGGLPRWDAATEVLGKIAQCDPRAACQLLAANVAALADGLLFRQANGGDGLVSFLNTAMRLDETAVLEAFRRIDSAAARRSWQERLRGGSEEQAAMTEILALAKRAGGAVAALASEVETQPANSREPGD